MHLGSSQGGATVSNTAGWGFDSFRACDATSSTVGRSTSWIARLRSGTSTLTTEETSIWGQRHLAPHGPDAPWGAPGCRPAVFRHRGFYSLPAHEARHARRHTEAIRLDEGPVSKTGRGLRGPCGCESHRFLHTAVVQRRRRRALNPEAGVRLPVALPTQAVPGRRVARGPVVTRKVGFEPLPGSTSSPGGREARRVAAVHETGVRIPPGCRLRSVPPGPRIAHVVVVQGRGPQHATLKDAGSNPADHTMRGSGIGAGSYPMPGGFDSRSRDHADVAQRERHGAQNAVSVGSNPTVSTNWMWRNGSAPASGAGGWRFESSHSDQALGGPARATARRRAMRGGGTGTTPGPGPGDPCSSRGFAAIGVSSAVSGCWQFESACCAGRGYFLFQR